jgi:hypothetical protein
LILFRSPVTPTKDALISITDSSSRLDLFSFWLEVVQIRLLLAANIAGKIKEARAFS